MAGHQIVTQRIAIFGVMVMAGYVLEQAAHMLTQGVIDD
jgi:hypothetical protein